MRHMTSHEVLQCDILVPKQMDQLACMEQESLLIRCWKANGFEHVDYKHHCFNFENEFKLYNINSNVL